MTPEGRFLFSTLDEWLRNRPQSRAVKDRELHAKIMTERYHERTRSTLYQPRKATQSPLTAVTPQENS